MSNHRIKHSLNGEDYDEWLLNSYKTVSLEDSLCSLLYELFEYTSDTGDYNSFL